MRNENRPWATSILRAPPPPPPLPRLNHTNFFLNLDMSKTLNEMLTANNRDELYILTPYRGEPPNLSKIRG